jgi:hypothetical protein
MLSRMAWVHGPSGLINVEGSASTFKRSYPVKDRCEYQKSNQIIIMTYSTWNFWNKFTNSL